MVSSFRQGECLSDGRRSRVVRAIADDLGHPVIIKRLKTLHPTANAVAMVTREFEITQTAAADGVIRALSILEADGQVGIVFEDFGGRPLSELRSGPRVPVGDLLQIAVTVADTLVAIHGLGIVHKDISPDNLLWNRETGTVKLIDFGISQILERESVDAKPVAAVEGTLEYIPPEQTGRMNRVVDRRSDLYALGATLYELFTGRPPFIAVGPLELIHAHLAKRPKAPVDIEPSVPQVVSNIILTLLEKRAEDRYQTALGLRADLERCLERWTDTGKIQPFLLGQDDLDDRLRIPQRLFGRSPEIDQIRIAFDSAAGGRARLLLVHGHAGIGKTSLVRELYRALPERHATLVEGKADQYSRGTPYASLIQAFGTFVRRALSEDAASVQRWKRRIVRALGPNAGILEAMVPEIRFLIGPSPEPPSLMPADTRNRFRLVVTSFVRAISTANNPLVIFLDDLHWADPHSIEMIEGFVTDLDTKHLLFIGSYRTNEVQGGHPLESAITRMTNDGARIQTIELGPLSESESLELVRETVGNRGLSNADSLAAICFAKTRGNPFFLKSFLEAMADEKVLSFDPKTRSWQWDESEVNDRSMTENVVDFVSNQILDLPDESQRALQAAACIGDSFNLRTLALALGQSQRETVASLREVLAAEMVTPSDSGFWFSKERISEDSVDFCYRFSHDRIRQAARLLTDQGEAIAVHLAVGRFLRDQLSKEPELVFRVVDHLNHAISEITSTDEMFDLGRLNLRSGRRALGSAAFESADEYFNRASELLGPTVWREGYDDALALHIEGARAAYLCGHLDRMTELVESAKANGRTVVDRVSAGEVELQALVGAQSFQLAIETGRALLAELKVELPSPATDTDVEAAVGSTIGVLSSTASDQFDALPMATDPTMVAAARIQTAMLTSAYLAEPKLLPILACNIVRSTLEQGICRDSPYGFSVVALVLNAINQIELAYSTGRVALNLLDRIDDTSIRPRAMHVVNIHVNPFVDKLRDTLDNIDHVFEYSLQCGDLEYAGWSLHNAVCQAFYAGVTLDRLRPLDQRNMLILTHQNQLPAIACAAPFSQALENLIGNSEDPSRLVGLDYDENEQREALEAVNFRGARFILGTVSTFVRYVFRDLAGAVEAADSSGKYADGATATQHNVWWHVYRSLAILARLDSGETEELEGLSPSLDQLRIWQAASPVNQSHHVCLIEAEIARVGGDISAAMDLYEQAIRHARVHGFTHEEAIANELTGRFHLALGSMTAARAYLSEASYVYSRWGATAKARQLEDEFADRFAIGSLNDSPTDALGRRLTSLDLDSLFKAANVISSETRLDHLPRRILDVAIENAGATRGYLILEEKGILQVVAGRDANGNELTLPGTTIEGYVGLPRSIFSYVARTGETVVLEDARGDKRWESDESLSRNEPTSVFCTPILHQGTRSGIVYLENNLTAGAFTPGRARVLELLATQAAISIENARQTEELRARRDDLEILVNERTYELDKTLGELREANTVLNKLSTTDALTGLPNRRYFERRMSEEWARARRGQNSIGILMVDIDCFKAYNDSFGHQRGDHCLQGVAAALGGAIRRSTDFVARVGGEEFAVVLPGGTTEAAKAIAEAMIKSVFELNLQHPTSMVAGRVTVSVGVRVRIPDLEEESAMTMLEEADAQLYVAKDAGRNQLSISADRVPADSGQKD